MEENRRDPEQLLKMIKSEEEDSHRGHLKIFFGYAAGVGKTYAMLKAARKAKKQGIDVVAGYIEPHTRPETMALLDGLEQLPRLEIEHKGILLKEFHLDAAIARKPGLILVDELAHTNAEPCRHAKRYQDIGELLKAGIDVYTTVNVQHIESLNDMVAGVTGVTVRERIPDHVFDSADQVELVDIEPEDLIVRLQAGKVYKEAQAKSALSHFFDVKNLIALREIALRRCADRINKMSEKVRMSQSSGYYTDEHILVCLSSSPTNARIIRTAARMADAFKGTFTALYVETPASALMEDDNKNRLVINRRLAEQLGAKIETVYGDDIAFQIAEFARISGVSKIVLGRSNVNRRFLFGRAPLTEQLIYAAPNLDVYIIPEKDVPRYREKRQEGERFKFTLSDTLKSTALMVAATMAGFVFFRLGFSESNIIMVYILGVLLTAMVTSQRMYSLVSSIVNVLLFNYFFTDPRYSLNAYDTGYPITFLTMFLSAFIASGLAVRIKKNARLAARTAYRTRILLDTNQLLQKAREKEDIMEVTAHQLTKLLQKDVVFYLVQKEQLSEPHLFFHQEPNQDHEHRYDHENEKAVAAWVCKNNKHAGATTSTLGSAKCLYLAVRVNEVVYGVVGIAMEGQPLDSFEHSVLLSILGESALAMESDQALKEREESKLLAKNEQLRANLLRSISHDLRTPLTSISGNAGILMASEEVISKDKKQKLYSDIFEDSLWLINLVENLLSVTKIEDGSMHLNLQAELLDEVLTEALRHIGRGAKTHEIAVIQEDELLLAKMDARLIVQVIINMVDNAVKYTPDGSKIEISVKHQGDFAQIEVSDSGEGLSDEVKEKVFEMFFTANNKVADSRRSLGLGLSLCKSIITAHGGEIYVKDNKPKGSVFGFTLPAKEVTVYE